MSAKHTPGPWKVVGPDPVSRNPHMGLWSVDGLSNVANQCTFADARLIAAAPDLLKLAQANLNTMREQRRRMERAGLSSHELDAAITEAEAAIAKALPLSPDSEGKL